MRFGPTPLARATGGILAHSLRLPDGRLVRKGRILTEEILRELEDGGFTEVTAALFDPDDVPEDVAAARIARALCGTGAEVRAPGTGRCNLAATSAGILTLSRDRIEALNAVSEAVTVATLHPDTPVHPGTLLATVKIIPYAISESTLARCLETVTGASHPAVGVWAFRPRSAALIQTRLPGMDESLLDRTDEILGHRLTALGSHLDLRMRRDHTEADVADAVAQALAAGHDPVLVLGASAIGDRNDVVPRGMERAGACIVRLGIPVDPGNLTLLATHGDRTLLGVPGCARSPKRNGFDMVLERVLAGRLPTTHDVATWGVGGMLKDFSGRPQPRQPAGDGEDARSRPRIAAVILAAGRSTRMGERNKLLEEVEGRPIVRRVAEEVQGLPLDPVVVVTGHEEARIRECLDGLPVRYTHNPDFADGISTSIRAGVEALPPQVDGVLVILGDMPWISHRDVGSLLEAFAPDEGRGICVPVMERKRGNPVLWASRYFPRLTTLEGDRGARALLTEFAEDVVEVPVRSAGVLLDVDTPDVLEKADS